MEKKQTAVEWLEQAYWDNKGTLSQKHFDQAKQMEKNQIIDAYYQGAEDEASEHGVMIWDLTDAKRYYNDYYINNNESRV